LTVSGQVDALRQAGVGIVAAVHSARGRERTQVRALFGRRLVAPDRQNQRRGARLVDEHSRNTTGEVGIAMVLRDLVGEPDPDLEQLHRRVQRGVTECKRRSPGVARGEPDIVTRTESERNFLAESFAGCTRTA
jgi:hypothetical protein